MPLETLFVAIEDSPIGAAMRESAVLFPTVEGIHVIGLTFVVGSIAAIDLRLLGVHGREYAVTRLSSELLPWTWSAFVLSAATGLLLFSSAATNYATNVAFQIKLVLMAAAGLNMAFFHLVTWRRVHEWDLHDPPVGARAAGALSLLFWLGVITFGRWIGFI